MKHIIEFNLSSENPDYLDEEHDLRQMMKAKTLFIAIGKFDEYMRGIYKWGDGGVPFTIDSCREKWYEIMNDYDIDLDAME